MLFLHPTRMVLEKIGISFDTYMRLGNIPDGYHDKITWKRSRDVLTRCRDNVISRRYVDVLQQRYWVFHLRLTGGVADTYQWDIIPLRHTTDTSWWRTTETSSGFSFETYLRCCGNVLTGRRCYVILRRFNSVPIRRRGEVPLRRLGNVPPRRR